MNFGITNSSRRHNLCPTLFLRFPLSHKIPCIATEALLVYTWRTHTYANLRSSLICCSLPRWTPTCDKHFSPWPFSLSVCPGSYPSVPCGAHLPLPAATAPLHSVDLFWVVWPMSCVWTSGLLLPCSVPNSLWQQPWARSSFFFSLL